MYTPPITFGRFTDGNFACAALECGGNILIPLIFLTVSAYVTP